MAHCLGCFNFYSMEVPILALFYFRFWSFLCAKLGITIIFTISELCWWMCTMYILCCSHVVLFCTLDDNFGHQHLMSSSPTKSIGVRFLLSIFYVLTFLPEVEEDMKIAYILDCGFLFYLFAIILNFYREAEISPSPTFATVCCLFPTPSSKKRKTPTWQQ